MKIAFKKNETSVAMNPLVSLFCCVVARSRRKRGNRQTDRHTYKPSTVTLDAHARQGLKTKCLVRSAMCGSEPLVPSKCTTSCATFTPENTVFYEGPSRG